MSVLTIDVVGRAMFGADLVTEAPPLKRSLATGQRLALLGAFLPAPRGPMTTWVVQRLARRLATARSRTRSSNSSATASSRPREPGSHRRRGDTAGTRNMVEPLAAARETDGSTQNKQEIRNE